MLFDLQGKRRRAVQGTYVVLAVLMAAGLVLFGIGSQGGGGLFDGLGIGGGHGGGTGGTTGASFEDQIDRFEDQFADNPRNERAAVNLVEARYRAGISEADAPSDDDPHAQPQFGEEALEHFREATAVWERYLDLDPKRPDQGAAQVVAQAYVSLGDARGAAQAQEIVAEARPSANSLGTLALYHYLGGDTRAGDKAAKRALAEAPRDQRSQLRQQLDAAKQQARSAARGGAQAPSGG